MNKYSNVGKFLEKNKNHVPNDFYLEYTIFEKNILQYFD